MNKQMLQIENYVSGKMSKAEAKAFVETMKKNPELEQQVKVAMLEREAAIALIQKDFQKKIKKIRATQVATKETLKTKPSLSIQKEARIRQLKPLRRWMAIAASLLFLLAIGGVWYANNSFSNANLATAHLVEADMGGDKSGEGSQDAAFLSGLASFQKGDYRAAIRQLQTISEESENQLAARYYVAHSYLRLKDFDKAQQHFQFLLQQEKLPAFIDKEGLQWNSLLARWGSGTIDENLRQELETFAQTASPTYQKKAAILQGKLDSFWRNLVF